MAIAHKETRSGTSANTTTPDLVNIASPASGDLLLAGVVTNSTHNVSSPPSGWTMIVQDMTDTASDCGLSLYYKVAGGSEPSTYTDWLTFGASEIVLPFISAWTGVHTTTPMDTTPLSEGSGSATAHDTPAITPVTAGAMLVAVMVADPAGAQSFTWDGGITPRLNDDGGAAGDFFVTIGSKTWTSGATSLGGDLSVADPMPEVIVALRPAGGVTVERSASLSATTAPLVALFRRDLLRQTATAATGSVQVSAFVRALLRQASVSATGAITVSGVAEAGAVERAVAFNATAGISVGHMRELFRQLELSATADIQVQGFGPTAVVYEGARHGYIADVRRGRIAEPLTGRIRR